MDKDLPLVLKVKETGDNNALLTLINSNTGLFLSIVDSYLPDNQFPIQKNDLRDSKDFYIYKSVMSYDPSRGMKFSTYLGQDVKWKCLSLRTRGKEKDTVSFDALAVQPPEEPYEVDEGKVNIERIFAFAEKYPSDIARTIIDARYKREHKKPWKQIAAELNISVPWAMIIRDNFLKDAKEHFCHKEAD